MASPPPFPLATPLPFPTSLPLLLFLATFTPLRSPLASIIHQAISPLLPLPATTLLSPAPQLLEVYALEIQMHTEQGNKKKLKELYLQALAVKSAIPHPRILGVIRECGGKMHMRERQWTDAATSFFEAFKSYDEAGHPRRLQCLKYLVLATMLSASGVDPFNAQEAKPFKSGEMLFCWFLLRTDGALCEERMQNAPGRSCLVRKWVGRCHSDVQIQRGGRDVTSCHSDVQIQR